MNRWIYLINKLLKATTQNTAEMTKLIVTGWDDFRNKEFYKGKVVIDGRRADKARIVDYYEEVYC